MTEIIEWIFFLLISSSLVWFILSYNLAIRKRGFCPICDGKKVKWTLKYHSFWIKEKKSPLKWELKNCPRCKGTGSHTKKAKTGVN